MSLTFDFIESWNNTEGSINSLDDIFHWINRRNREINVTVEKVDFSYNGFWYYDNIKGYIRNKKNSFFQLAGYQEIEDDKIVLEQPIIIQNEIGYLGIICKKINGVINFLMQAKIEPGNVNVIQISPTIQATKSNFTRSHGGSAPAYLEYFVNAEKYTIVVDQLQSEQSSRFYKKRNRNIIIYIEQDADDINVLDSHMWMTLGQIKECLKKDNLVNMDTRTVLSCIPFNVDALEEDEYEKAKENFNDSNTFLSIFKPEESDCIHSIFNEMNNIKMYMRHDSRLLPLKSMKGWDMTEREIVCKKAYDFKVIYCRINIGDREVTYWEQPLVEALGQSVFGLFTKIQNGIRKYLIRVKSEPGCFDYVELGPTIQLEPTNIRKKLDNVEKLFLEKLNENNGIVKNLLLSEEGGRFYHEQNRNVIIAFEDELKDIPKGYFWADYATINSMIQFNNCVNIQLRNMMTLVDM